MNVVTNIENWIYSHTGYNFLIRLEDFILLVAGIFIGIIILSILSGRSFYYIHKIKDMDEKLKLISITKRNGEKIYLTNPKNVFESIELLLIISFRPKNMKLRHKNHTKLLLGIVSALGVILIIWATIIIYIVYIPT